MLNIKQLKIGGQIFKIKINDNLIHDRGCYGEVNFRTNEIILDNNANEQKLKETLLHEILEVLNGLCELDLSHITVKTLTFGLHQVLKDNGLVF